MSRGAAEFRGEKGLDQIPGQFQALDAPAQTDQIEIIILNALSGGEMVLDQTRAYCFDFIGANRSTDTAATYGYAAIHFSRGQCPAERDNEVGIIIIRRQLVSPEITYFVARGFESRNQPLLQAEAAMVCGYSDAHDPSLNLLAGNSPPGYASHLLG